MYFRFVRIIVMACIYNSLFRGMTKTDDLFQAIVPLRQYFTETEGFENNKVRYNGLLVIPSKILRSWNFTRNFHLSTAALNFAKL